MKITLPNAGIVLLVGVSNSGKTTLLNKWIDEQLILSSEVISSDEYRAVVGDTEFIQWAERPRDEADSLSDDYHALSREAFRLLDYALEARCRLNKLTFVDATHLYAEDRKHYIGLAKRHHVPITAIVLDIPQEILLERDALRKNPRGKKRVKQQFQNWKRELRFIKKEGFKSVYFIREDDDIDLIRKENPLLVEVGKGIDIIGDVHGCYDELMSLLLQMGYEQNEEELYIHPEGRKFMSVGDIMSRGPESLKTMQFFQRHVEQGLAYMTDSNHGWKIARWLDGRNVELKHGDEKVAQEFEQYEKEHGSSKVEELKETLKKFLLKAPSHYVLEKNGVKTAVCTHAGIKDEYIGKQSTTIQDFCRYGDTEEINTDGKPIRKDWYVHHKGSLTIVWGHDPKPQPLRINNTINIDQGVAFGGRLTAMRYPEQQFVSVKALKDYSGTSDNPLKKWEIERLIPPNIEKFINGYSVQTEQLGEVKIHGNIAKSAIDTVSHYTVPIEQLLYIPPTMSPTPSVSALLDYLEHPKEAIEYYRNHGVETMVAEKKHMGSRAVLLLFKNQAVAKKEIGFEIDGVIYTRTGRRFFDRLTEQEVVRKLTEELTHKRYFEKYQTDYVLLDAEIMPWNLKAKELISSQYAHVSENALLDRKKIVEKLKSANDINVENWIREYDEKLNNAEIFKEVFQKYCWDIEETEAIQIAPFHVMAHSEETFFHKPHTWHMEMNKEFAKDSSLFVTTEFKIISDSNSEKEVIAWWEEMTKEGHEGIVIKPEIFTSTFKGRLIQPAIKVRGRKYLHIIYGMDYLSPENLKRLKNRNTGKKQKLALKEFSLGLEGIRRFVDGESIERVHECVLATLALESDPVDPRL
ncbi:polynucleotide kinase-phosphatase [Psychrobacillus sp. NEAU-3TGS]|uniref:polynucleotide kinase-phosphatase n=1 Tax=Psychrobacillus sp. NEAU-3TGS TaxID=2995412 RepID=UPI002498FE3E|nr:polynucleotide kinase-phosphatase [Psychrobacillus sp. NEAU-3TGS]MDI2588380.1 polynucleotide kinase-phosphatase [Psychrobacillus sp. NEAU-3TGS]